MLESVDERPVEPPPAEPAEEPPWWYLPAWRCDGVRVDRKGVPAVALIPSAEMGYPDGAPSAA